MAQQQAYREPPPYPGHSKHMNNTPGKQTFANINTKNR